MIIAQGRRRSGCNLLSHSDIHFFSVQHFTSRWIGYRLMKLSALLLASVVATSLFVCASDAPRGAAPSPVLVELFTSEGCSSCPPADTLLQQLDRTQPVSGAELIVLSEHVDYWNHIGWTDPFSSRFFSDRQSAYAGRFGLASVYTPQMVVDGAVEFVGERFTSCQPGDSEILACAENRHQNFGALAGCLEDPQRLTSTLTPCPRAAKVRKADVYLVVALNHAESQVLRGENGGRRLSHVGVVQSLTKIGSIEAGKTFSQDVHLKLDSRSDPANLRIIAFIQQSGQRQVLGAAQQMVQK